MQEYIKWKKHLKTNQNEKRAYNNLAIIYYVKKMNFQKAKNCYEDALRIDPNYQTAKNNLVNMCYSYTKKILVPERKYDEIINLADEILSIGIESAKIYHIRAIAYHLNNYITDALRNYEEALRQNDKSCIEESIINNLDICRQQENRKNRYFSDDDYDL